MDDAMQDKLLDPSPPDDVACRDHGVELVFNDRALLCAFQHADREALCARPLNLVARSTPRRRFAIEREVVERPDKYLSDLVVQCYRGTEPSAYLE